MELSIFIPCYNEQSASLIRGVPPGGHQSVHVEKKRGEPTRPGKGPDPACFCRRRVSGWSVRMTVRAALEQNGQFNVGMVKRRK